MVVTLLRCCSIIWSEDMCEKQNLSLATVCISHSFYLHVSFLVTMITIMLLQLFCLPVCQLRVGGLALKVAESKSIIVHICANVVHTV